MNPLDFTCERYVSRLVAAVQDAARLLNRQCTMVLDFSNYDAITQTVEMRSWRWIFECLHDRIPEVFKYRDYTDDLRKHAVCNKFRAEADLRDVLNYQIMSIVKLTD